MSSTGGFSQDIAKIVITNDASGTPAKADLGHFETDMKALSKVVNEAMNSMSYFSAKLKSIDTVTGKAVYEMFVQKSELDNVLASLNSKNAEWAMTKHGSNYAIQDSQVDYTTGTITLHGKQAQARAKAQVAQIAGGQLVYSPTNANPDRYQYVLPLPQPASTMTQKDINDYRQGVFSESSKLSRKEARKRKEEADERKRKEEDKLASKQMQEEKKKDEESAQKTASFFKTVIALMATLVAVARRILVSTLDNASKIDKQIAESSVVGASYLDRRSADIFDKAHNMSVGTTFGAWQDIQKLWGDTTNLDEKSIGILARVMGGDVGQFARAGLGSSNPQLFTEKIIDAFFKQWQSGKNSLNQNVGKQQALMELNSVLEGVSPNLAKLFSRMVNDYQSGYYDKFNNYEEWRNTTNTNRTRLHADETVYASEIGKTYNEILAIVEDLKTSFFTRLANSMDSLLGDIKNLRVGMSASDSLEEDRKNYAKNVQTEKELKARKEAYEANVKGDLVGLNNILPADKSNETRFIYSLDTLYKIATGDTESLKTNIHGTGMLSSAEVKDYVNRGKKLLQALQYNPDLLDEYTRVAVINRVLSELAEQQSKGIGGGIKALSLSSSGETTEAYSLLKAGLVFPKPEEAYKDGKVNNPYAVAIWEEAYRQYLQDNPEAFNGLAYLIFGKDFRSGSIIDGTIVNASKEEAKNIPASRKKEIQKEAGKELKKLKKEAEKEKGTELTQEEIDALILDLLVKYNTKNFAFGHKNQFDSSNKANIWTQAQLDKLAESLFSADSYIMGAIMGSGIALPQGNYSYNTGKNINGQYILTIVDEKGKAMGSIPLNENSVPERAGVFKITDEGFDFSNASMSE